MEKLKTAVVGVGYLGTFHAEKLACLPESHLVAVADSHITAAQRLAQRLEVEAVTDYRQLLGKVDAVSIAVPTQYHFVVASAFLKNRVHVLLEKPIATTLEEAQGLVDLAAQQGRILQIGHLERFNPAVLALEKVIQQPLFIESHRLAPFKPRGTDVSVVLDLMIHDIDLILNLVNAPIRRIDASGVPVLSSAIDIVNARLQFANRCVANVTASRVSLKSERKMRVFQHDAYLTIDFQNNRLGIHRKDAAEIYPGIQGITSEEQDFPKGDVLATEIAAFLSAIRHGRRPLVNGEDGTRALATAIEINRQLAR
jgi:predicted dehydrogenase